MSEEAQREREEVGDLRKRGPLASASPNALPPFFLNKAMTFLLIG